MAYFIFEDGETVGPLKIIEVIERAHPDTFVSHGQEWVRFDQHPDFVGLGSHASISPPPPPAIINNDVNSDRIADIENKGERASDSAQPPSSTSAGYSTPIHNRGESAEERRSPLGTQNPRAGVGNAGAPRHQGVSETRPQKKTAVVDRRSKTRWSIAIPIAVAILVLVGAAAVFLLAPPNSMTASVVPDQGPDLADQSTGRSADSTIDSPEVMNRIEKQTRTLENQLENVKADLRPLRAEYDNLAREYPFFGVNGKIRDRGEDWVLIFGTAHPSNGDGGHLGTVFEEGNIQVVGAVVQNPLFFAHQRVYFIEKTTGTNSFGAPVPLRVYSTKPPGDHHKAEEEMRKINTRMAPLYAQIKQLEGEINRLAEEGQRRAQESATRRQMEIDAQAQDERRREWEAVADSPSELRIYAEEHWAKGDQQGAEKACAQAEKSNSNDAAFWIFCGQISEELGSLNKALSRYEQAIKYSPEEPAPNRRLAYLRSTNEIDPFERARLLVTYLHYANGAEQDYAEVQSRLSDLTNGWGREARGLILEIDNARSQLPGLELMQKFTHRDNVARDIQRLESNIDTCNGQVDNLRNLLANVDMDIDEMVRDSKDDSGYWRSRSKQVSNLRSSIKSAENSLKTAYRDGEAAYRREQIQAYMVILKRIEEEARGVGVAL